MTRMRKSFAEQSNAGGSGPAASTGAGNAWKADTATAAADPPGGLRSWLVGHNASEEAGADEPTSLDGWLPGHNASAGSDAPESIDGWLPGHNTSEAAVRSAPADDLDAWLPGHVTSEASALGAQVEGFDPAQMATDPEAVAALNADVATFIEETNVLFTEHGLVGEEHMDVLHDKLAEFLGVEELYDEEALAAMKDEDFVENGIEGVMTELSPEAQARLTALTIGMGPEQIEALAVLSDVGLRSDAASDDDKEKSAISMERYLGGMMPISLLVGRQLELDGGLLPQNGVSGTGNTLTGAGATAADIAFDLFPPTGTTGALPALATASKGLGAVMTAVSAFSIGHEIINGEFFNSGNDVLEGISAVTGGAALFGGPAAPFLAGISALTGVASVFVSETDLIDRPVDEFFNKMDEQLSGQEEKLMELRTASDPMVDQRIEQEVALPVLEAQLGGPAGSTDEAIIARRQAEIAAITGHAPDYIDYLGAWPPVPYNPALFDMDRAGVEARVQDIRSTPTMQGPISPEQEALFQERAVLEATLGVPSDVDLATAGLKRDRTNAAIDVWSLDKVGGRIAQQAHTGRWRDRIEIRDQRSDEVYRSAVPEHAQTDPFLPYEWGQDRNEAVEDYWEVEREIAETEERWS